MTLFLVGLLPAFLGGYLLAHHHHIRGLRRILAERTAEHASALAALANVEPREQLARELARAAIAADPRFAVPNTDQQATLDWMEAELINTGKKSFLRVCTSIEAMREHVTSQPRHAGDAIVFPVFLARELLGLPPFDGTEQKTAVLQGGFVGLAHPKPQVRHE